MLGGRPELCAVIGDREVIAFGKAARNRRSITSEMLLIEELAERRRIKPHEGPG